VLSISAPPSIGRQLHSGNIIAIVTAAGPPNRGFLLGGVCTCVDTQKTGEKASERQCQMSIHEVLGLNDFVDNLINCGSCANTFLMGSS